MKIKRIYSVTGLFDTADDIINAAKTISGEGFKNWDVNTPYPVHGMDYAMKLKSSPLGYFTLFFGLSGATLALLFMWYTMAVDYPNIIGGKPFFPLPAFIPITFEVTVLLGSLGTVAVMIFFFFKLPNNSHPLQDTNYIRSVSVDKFGVSIEAKDPMFEEDKIKDYLKSLGAKDIETIYYDDEEIHDTRKIFEPKFIIFLVFVSIVSSGVAYLALNKVAFAPPWNFMMNQDKLNPQKPSDFFADGFGMRPPVNGTVSRSDVFVPVGDVKDSLWKSYDNPQPLTEKSLNLGRKKFNIYCSPCHGMYARGKSRLRGQFPSPPSLHSAKVRNWKDSKIFEIITIGQNSMPSYASQLTVHERWAVVNYVRALQRALNAKEEDLK